MVVWQSRIFLVLLLAFSGFDLIQSDCGTDVDRINGGFCDNRNLRRFDDTDSSKDLARRFRDLERRGSYLKVVALCTGIGQPTRPPGIRK